jgi:hypothetical protein
MGRAREATRPGPAPARGPGTRPGAGVRDPGPRGRPAGRSRAGGPGWGPQGTKLSPTAFVRFAAWLQGPSVSR